MCLFFMGYDSYQIQKEKEFENICMRCGNCCGVQDDPCIHLIQEAEGKYFCDIYVSRGGTQKTRSGRFFECVSIRTILNQEWPGHWKCAYKKQEAIFERDLEHGFIEQNSELVADSFK